MPSSPSVWVDVQPRAHSRVGGGQQAHREQADDDADRDVDQEDPVPIEVVGEDAAEQHADRAAARRDEAEHAHRLGPLGRLGEEGHHQGQRHGRGNGPADALHRASRDEQPLRGRQAAAERRQREERDAGEEQAAVAVEIPEAPAQQQAAAEGEHVGVDDPGKRRLREAEIGADRGQRDVHDGRVEHDHEAPPAEHDQREPAPPCVGVLLRCLDRRYRGHALGTPHV